MTWELRLVQIAAAALLLLLVWSARPRRWWD